MNLKSRFQNEFKMTKKEKILTVILAIILVGYGIYQTAFATNESSYKYGFRTADFARGSGCDDTDGDCDPSAVSNCNTQ
jgi:hypothetical protein